jgi:hypothetical protein
MMTRREFCLSATSVIVGLNATGAIAQSLPTPTGKVILTIGGQVAASGQAPIAFDREGLEALGMASFETMTPWYKTKVTFEGVPMATLMLTVGAKGQKLSVAALNDYTTEIPMEDFEKYNVILALKRDGQYMPVSDKGPLFIVYPFDANPELKTQKFYGRSAWQVARMTVS